MMGPIEEALRKKFFSTLFRGEEINANFQKILGHGVKHSVAYVYRNPGCQKRFLTTPPKLPVRNWWTLY